MKRNYFTFIFAFVLSLMAFNVNAQVTVGTGTNEGQAVPIEAYYGYTYSESIYLQTEIGASGPITTLSWYFSGTSNLANTQDIVIWMGHTAKTDFTSNTDWVGNANLTQVYAGLLGTPTGPGWIQITLDNAFNYNNTDNLVIAVDENTASYDAFTDDFYCTAVPNARSIYYRDDNTNPDPLALPTASGTLSFIPNVILGGITQACPAPSAGTTANVTLSSADLSWTAGGSETSWNVEYGAAGFSQGSGTTVPGVTNPYALSNLSASTSYDYYVQADCGGQGTSLWAGPFNFATPCATFTAPFTENFDGLALTSPYTALPNCWTPQVGPDYWDVTNNSTNSAAYLSGFVDHTTGSGNFMWIDGSGGTPGITANEMETPMIDMSSLTTPFVGFWFASNNTNGAINHSINLDAWDGTAWVNITSLAGNFPSWVEVSGPVPAGIPSTTKFRIYALVDGVNTGSHFHNDLGVDDFFVIEAPSCFAPTALAATNVTATTADFGWTATGPETAWDIEYGLAGFTQGAGTMVTATATNPHSISGLTDASDYTFYVRANCGNATSLWAGPYNFTTLCLPFTAPFTENFDGLALTSPYTALPNCWDAQVGPDYWDVTNDVTNTGHSWLPNIGDHTTGSGNYMWIDASSDITVNEMVTPMIDMSGLNAGYAGFWFASNNTTNNINHTINLDAWDGAAWVNMASMSGNFPSWVEVGGVVPSGIPTTTKFRIYATADANGISSTYYFNDLGIDDFFVKEAPVNEVAVTAITVGNCSSTEAITIDITNNGVNAQTSVPVSLSINGAAATMEMWTGTLASGTTVQHTFVPTFDASVAGTYNMNASTGLAGDENTANDMLLSVVSATAVFNAPYGATFEGSTSLPTAWTTDGGITSGHNAGSNVIFRNMWGTGPQTFTTTTPKFAVTAGDFMGFDYRYVDYSAGTVGTTLGGDTLSVQVSTDCGVTFTTVDVIDASNHVSSANYARLSYDMTAYAGMTIVARVHATYGAGGTSDYYLDLDNFFVGVPMTQSATATDALCVGAANGSGTVTAADGLAPYTYAWSNGATTAMATGLSVGMNYYTVTDAAGSMIMDSVSVGEPAMAMSAMTSMDAMVSCNGVADAAVSVMGMNGTAPYTYAWTNGATTDSLMSIGAGTYTVLVTDANNCITLETVMISEPTAITSTSMSTDISCNGAADGTAMTTVAGGTGAYTYTWSNTATTDALTGLAAGTYDVTTTDANNCATTGSVTIAEPMAITATATTDANVDCNDDANGVVSVTAAGGTGMLSYMWSNNTTMASATNLAGGTYDVTVTDMNGCSETASATVTEAAALTLALATTSDSLYALAGSATATVTGGTAPYTYAWDGTTGTATLDGLGEGVYTVIVTDADGCTIEGFVSVADVVSTASIDYVTNLSIAPNPARDYATIELELSQNADVAISIYTITGVLVQDFAKENTSRQTHQVDLSNYADGMYFVRILIDNQIVTKKLVVTK